MVSSLLHFRKYSFFDEKIGILMITLFTALSANIELGS